ncbi:hypothetical protein [Priestia endophytica]|uniref:hypothetical protein n=1 Tax=Priestia endophytica TaxID=135735 RepID=UPI000F528D9E|nr:hypothetical protein [Priestia endophytica]RPJ97663.1 hypothetical protein FH5_04124 [Priestia endophytica]
MYEHEYDYDRKDYYHDKHDKDKKMKCYYEELENHPEYDDYYGKYDRKLDKHYKHDRYNRLKCYWEKPDNDHKHDNKKDYDNYKDKKEKFIVKGYIYYKEDHDCDCKKGYY